MSNSLAFDVSGTVAPDSWYGTILKGTVNFTPATTWLQAILWLAYLAPVTVLFFRPAKAVATSSPPQPAAANAAAG